MRHPMPTAIFLTTGLLLGVIGAPTDAEARQVRNGTRTSVNGGGGGRAQSASANRGGNANRSGNVNRSANVNNNTNVNRNVNVNQNVNVHRDIDVDVDHGHYHHPVATAVGVTAAVAVTAAVVGSIIYSLPPSCTAVVSAGVTYQQCGSTWYQPRYSGTQVSYVVVNPP